VLRFINVLPTLSQIDAIADKSYYFQWVTIPHPLFNFEHYHQI